MRLERLAVVTDVDDADDVARRVRLRPGGQVVHHVGPLHVHQPRVDPRLLLEHSGLPEKSWQRIGMSRAVPARVSAVAFQGGAGDQGVFGAVHLASHCSGDLWILDELLGWIGFRLLIQFKARKVDSS